MPTLRSIPQPARRLRCRCVTTSRHCGATVRCRESSTARTLACMPTHRRRIIGFTGSWTGRGLRVFDRCRAVRCKLVQGRIGSLIESCDDGADPVRACGRCALCGETCQERAVGAPPDGAVEGDLRGRWRCRARVFGLEAANRDLQEIIACEGALRISPRRPVARRAQPLDSERLDEM